MSLPPNRNILSEHLNPYYVETGFYRGDSLEIAHSCGFKNIIGMDNDLDQLEFVNNRFDLMNGRYPNIRTVHGDSAVHLSSVIQEINEPITFFLDAHFQLLEGHPRGENPFPLIQEIAQIAEHPIKTHTIIIDDILYLTHPRVTGWRLEDIIYQLRRINPGYHCDLIANPVIDNMMVVYL